MEDPAEAAAEYPSFWQLYAGALWVNGLVVAALGLTVLMTAVSGTNGYGPLFAVILTLALGTLGNLIGLLVNLFTGRFSQAVAHVLGLLIVGGLFCALWSSIMHSHIGKPPGG